MIGNRSDLRVRLWARRIGPVAPVRPSLPGDSQSPKGVVLTARQLTEVEAGGRTLKTDLDLRPVNHRKADRIHAHVLLCWLALLLVRTIEVRCGETWPRVRQEMDRLHRGVFEGPHGRFAQVTEVTARQHQYFKTLQASPPQRFQAIEPVLPGIEQASAPTETPLTSPRT